MALLVAAGACNPDDRVPEPSEEEHRDADPIIKTEDLAPVIVLEDLVPLGFDTTTLYRIEPHFHLLNGALITLAELKRSYDVTADRNERDRMNAYAVPFHLTADSHQRVILGMLSPPLDSVFDKYVEGKKRMASLEDWHADHRNESRTSELPGLVRTPR